MLRSYENTKAHHARDKRKRNQAKGYEGGGQRLEENCN